MKNQDLLAFLGIAGVAFALWQWKPSVKRAKTDQLSIRQDWQKVGVDIHNSMYRYDRQRHK